MIYYYFINFMRHFYVITPIKYFEYKIFDFITNEYCFNIFIINIFILIIKFIPLINFIIITF